MLWPDIQVGFENLTGESIFDHQNLVNQIIDELVEGKVIRYEIASNSMLVIWKSINFDKLESAMNSPQSNAQISIGSLNAQHVQVGNDNSMNINITAEQFANALSLLAQKESEEANSIAEKISSFVANGATMVEAVAKLIGLVGS